MVNVGSPSETIYLLRYGLDCITGQIQLLESTDLAQRTWELLKTVVTQWEGNKVPEYAQVFNPTNSSRFTQQSSVSVIEWLLYEQS